MQTVVKTKVEFRCGKDGRPERVEIPYEKTVFYEEDKMRIVSEYVQKREPAQRVIEIYHFSSQQDLFNWMDKYLHEESLSLSSEPNTNPMANKNPEERIKELEAEKRRLEESLELEKLRAKAYDTMINLAEKTFNIPIKKIWHQTVSLLREQCRGIALSLLCGLFGYSRQSYYKRDENEFAEDAIESLIVEKARDYRQENPGLGCVKLYLIIKTMFEETGCMPGRDVFIEILRKTT